MLGRPWLRCDSPKWLTESPSIFRAVKSKLNVQDGYRLLLARSMPLHDGTGEGGIRTLDTLLGYGALAKRCFRPLSHLTKIGCENMANNRLLPTGMREIRHASNFALIQRQSPPRESRSKDEVASEISFRKPTRSAGQITDSAILPFWFALLDEGINAFFGVSREHVLDHHFSGVAIGVLKPAFELPVERSLSDLDDIGRLRGDLAPERERLFPFIPGSNHAIDEADAQRVLSRDHIASKQHFHGMFARDVPRERHHRRRTEQADVDPGRCEFCGCGRNREIAGRNELTAGRRCDALDGRSNGLWQVHDLLHHSAAHLHDVFEISSAAIRVGPMPLEFLQVMAGGERWSISRQHNCTHA